MALGATAGIGGRDANNRPISQNTGINGGATPPQVQPAPPPPSFGSLFGGAPVKPAKGAFTQKNGTWYDSAGNELVQGAGGFTVKNQPQPQGFNFNLGGSMQAGGFMGGQAPAGTGGVGAIAPGRTGGNEGRAGAGNTGINGGRTQGNTGVNGGAGGGGFTNYAQTDPNITRATNAMYQAYQQQNANANQTDPFQMEAINNLRNQQNSNQTQRATDQATSQIRDFGAGQQQAANERRAQMGQGGGSGNAISGAAQRAQAQAAAQIQMGEQNRQDQLALQGANILNAPSQLGLARQGQANNLLSNLYGGADQQGRLALGEQGLGLEQWKAQNSMQYNPEYQNAMMNADLMKAQMGLQSQALGLQGNQMDLYSQYLRALQGGYSGYGY